MNYILIPLFCVKRKIMLINVWKRIFSVSFFLILYSVLYSTVCVPCVPPIMKKWWWWQMTITMMNDVIDNDWWRWRWWWHQTSLKIWWRFNDGLSITVNDAAPWSTEQKVHKEWLKCYNGDYFTCSKNHLGLNQDFSTRK